MKLPVAGIGVPWLYARCPGIVIPNERRRFHGFGEQRLPDGWRRPGEGDPRDAGRTANPLAPFRDLSFMGVGHRSKSFKSSAEVLQFAALTNATHEGFPIDRDDGLKQANGRLGQETEGLFTCRKQPLEFCDGGLSRLVLDPEGLVASDGVGPSIGSFLLDRRRETLGSEQLALGFSLLERRPFSGECLPSDPSRRCQARVRVLCFGEPLPEDAVAFVRVLAVVPAPEFLDRHVAILGYPVNQRLGRPEGLSELLPQ